MISTSRVAITKWENGTTRPEGENLYQLSMALQCSIEWLLHGKDDKMAKDKPAEYGLTVIARRVPLISWVQAGAWTDTCSQFTMSDVSEWIEVGGGVSSCAFALRVRGDSMQRAEGKSIPEGSIIIVDPQVEPTQNRVVVAMLDGGSEATVKQLVVDGPARYLVPWNSRYHPIPIDGNCRIVGVVTRVVMDL